MHRPYRLLVAAATVAAFVATTPAAHAAPLPTVKRCGDPTVASTPATELTVDVGTGETGGVPDAVGTVDQRWHTVPYGDVYSVTPDPAWVPVTDASWVNSRDTNAGSDDGTTTTVRFRTQFTLSPEVTNKSVEIEYAADNGVSFYLNGTPIGGYDPPPTAPLPSQVAAYSTMHTLIWGGLAGFQNGVNNLDAVVTDYGFSTGLVVRGALHGCVVRGLDPTTCVDVKDTGVTTYSPVPVDLGTGEDGYQPHAAYQVDGDWKTGPLGENAAYTVRTWNTPWYDQSTTSTWISLNRDARSPAKPGVSGGVATAYRITFEAPVGAYGGLDLHFASDNDVAFTLNGQPVGGYAGGPLDAAAFNQLHSLPVPNAPIVAGTNVLQAVVTDYGGITGLLVEGGAFLCRPSVSVVS